MVDYIYVSNSCYLGTPHTLHTQRNRSYQDKGNALITIIVMVIVIIVIICSYRYHYLGMEVGPHLRGTLVGKLLLLFTLFVKLPIFGEI